MQHRPICTKRDQRCGPGGPKANPGARAVAALPRASRRSTPGYTTPSAPSPAALGTMAASQCTMNNFTFGNGRHQLRDDQQ